MFVFLIVIWFSVFTYLIEGCVFVFAFVCVCLNLIEHPVKHEQKYINSIDEYT